MTDSLSRITFEESKKVSADSVVDELILGDLIIPNAALRYDYGDDFGFNVSFDLEGTSFIGKAFSEDPDFLVVGDVKTELLRTSTQYGSDGRVHLEFVTSRSPSLLYQNELPSSLTIFVINGPELHFSPYEISASDGQFCYSFRETADAKELRKSNRFRNGPILTGCIELRREDGDVFEFEEGFKAAARFQRFLAFVRGDTVTIGHCLGFNKAKEQVLLAAGFNKFGSPEKHYNWCGIGQVKELNALAERFFRCLDESEMAQVLAQAMEFYRSSTGIRNTSIEMAIVASSAALEVVVPYILKVRAKMDGNMLSEKIPFHSKLRACFGVIGLDCDPYDGLTALKKQSASLNDADAFELSTRYRNRIVHQGKQFPVTGPQLVEMWSFQMWMTEVLLLNLLGHTGTMFDRRPVSGWVGSGDTVPYPI